MANALKYTADIMYPFAEKIVIVTDNLNTHSPASLYKRFHRKKLADLRSVLSGIIHRSMAAGWIWRRLK